MFRTFSKEATPSLSWILMPFSFRMRSHQSVISLCVRVYARTRNVRECTKRACMWWARAHWVGGRAHMLVRKGVGGGGEGGGGFDGTGRGGRRNDLRKHDRESERAQRGGCAHTSPRGECLMRSGRRNRGVNRRERGSSQKRVCTHLSMGVMTWSATSMRVTS